MIVTLCIVVAILLLTTTVLASREVTGVTRIQLSWGLHGVSVLLILVALTSNGIWYSATTYLGDLWTIFEALHKTEQGLRSSLDYFSPIGPALQWILSITLLVQVPSASSIILANAMVATMALSLSVILLRGRTSAWATAIVGLIAVSTALSPRDLDLLIVAKESDFLAPYNRWGWALLVPVAMRAATTRVGPDLLGAILAGMAISLLLLLKVTYGAAALGLYAVAVAIQLTRWREGVLVGTSAVGALIIADLLTGGQVRAHVADLGDAARMPSNGLRIDKILMQFPAFSLFAIGTMVVGATRGEEAGRLDTLKANWRPLLLAGATGGAGIAVLMQNHYNSEPTLLLLMPLIMAEWTGLFALKQKEAACFWGSGGELRALIILVALALPAVDAGFIFAQKSQLLRRSADPALAETQFHDLVLDVGHLPGAGGMCGDSTCQDYRRMLGGRKLLQQHCGPGVDRTVLALNFSNPFPTLTGTPSPQGSPIWLHADRSFSPAIHVEPEILLGGVGCILEARDESNSQALMAIYAPTIRAGFSVKAQDADWNLWVRK